MNPNSKFSRALAAWTALERVALAALMLIMVALYVGGVMVRELLPAYARNFAWIDEATRYLMVWLVFLSLGLALGQGRQIAMTSFLERFSPSVQRAIRRAIDLSGLVLSLYIAWVGLEMAQTVGRTGQVSPTLGVSAALLYYALPVGFVLLALRYAMSLFGIIDRWSNQAGAH